MNGKFYGGKGTHDNPYLIEDIYDFNNIRIHPNKSYKLINNIDFSTPPFDKNFLPIPNFTGQLDGNGYKLQNVYIHYPNMDNVGIFSKMDIITNQYDENHRPYIKNLIVENADILGGSNVGILIGYLNYYYRNKSHNFMTYLDNIYVSGKLQGTKYLGSIIGGMYFEHNNYNNTFAKNIQISTKLTPTTNDSFNASFIGYITNNTRDYMKTCFILKDSYLSSKMDTQYITPMANHNLSLYNYSGMNLDSSHRYDTYNVIINKDEWNGDTYQFAGVNNWKYSQICSANLNSSFYELLTDKTNWRFWYAHAPELVELKKDITLIYVPATKKYYTYKNDDFVDVTGYDFKHFKDIDNFEFNNVIIKKAIAKFTSNIKIVTIVDKEKGIVLNEPKTIEMTRDSSNDLNSYKYSFRTTFKFSDIGNPIFSMRNSTNDKQ